MPISNTDQPDPTDLEAHHERIVHDGFTILESVIEPEFARELARDLERLERELEVAYCKNEFEGTRTTRIYNLLAHGELYERIPVHEAVLPLVERVLDDGCLISSLSSISIDPGETAQLLHADDQLIPLEKPHSPIVCNTMWALTDFTAENGATRFVPGSHRSDRNPHPFDDEAGGRCAEMPLGSVLVWNGSLWHGGGANASDARRVGVAMNYCAGFIRQQENQQLGVPRELARGFAPRLQRLLGYGVYNNLIGHIDKHDPIEILGADPGDTRMVWDR
jgi:ectoine hydroxylase-related dioxygenase (phytanoyl-CoA dioxygenase family)